MTGYILSGEGDLQGLFSNKSRGAQRGAGRAGLVDGITRGAKTLDAFEPYLPRLYNQYGFRPVNALPFSDEYAPPSWDFGMDGRPDVVFMEFKGDSRDRQTLLERSSQNQEYKNPRGKGYTEESEGDRATSSWNTSIRPRNGSGHLIDSSSLYEHQPDGHDQAKHGRRG